MIRSEKKTSARGAAPETACHTGAPQGPQVYSVGAPPAPPVPPSLHAALRSPRLRAWVPPLLVESLEGA